MNRRSGWLKANSFRSHLQSRTPSVGYMQRTSAAWMKVRFVASICRITPTWNNRRRRLVKIHVWGVFASAAATDVAVLRLDDPLEQRDMPHVRGSELRPAKRWHRRKKDLQPASSTILVAYWSTDSVLIHSNVVGNIHNHTRDGFHLYGALVCYLPLKTKA